MNTKKQLLLAILAIVSGTGLLIGLLWSSLMPSSNPSSSSSSSSSNIQTAWVETEEDTIYNAQEGVLSQEQFGSTILPKTSDAGTEYIDGTLFIGDSNTVRMMAYGHTTLENTIGVISMGIQHVPTKKCVYFQGKNGPVTIPEAVAIMQPQRIIITYGTNNTIGWSSKKFVEEYKKALEAITKAWPYADIIINAVPPVDKYRQNTGITMQTIDSFNKALAEMAQELGYKFLDSSEALKDSATGFAKQDYTYSDGVHLNKKAMEALFDYIKTHSYITEDRRPKPLKKIPQRKETPPDIITEDPLAVRGSAESMDDSDSDNSSSKSNKKTFPISFIVHQDSAGMGYINGTVSQNVGIGQACTSVEAIPSVGYEFVGWGCTVGRIPDVNNPSLTFSVPGDVPKEGITVFAKFKLATCICTTQCSEQNRNPNCKACVAGIGNCKGQPVATPTPTPPPTTTPSPDPTLPPESSSDPVIPSTPSPSPDPTPTPTPEPPPVVTPSPEVPPSPPISPEVTDTPESVVPPAGA